MVLNAVINVGCAVSRQKGVASPVILLPTHSSSATSSPLLELVDPIWT
jgi:hypothetical protein